MRLIYGCVLYTRNYGNPKRRMCISVGLFQHICQNNATNGTISIILLGPSDRQMISFYWGGGGGGGGYEYEGKS